MTKRKFFYLLTIFFIFLLLFFFYKKTTQKKFYPFTINGKRYQLLTATNPSQWQKGLMNFKSKKELKGADGMIFIFPEKQPLTFWNKNTYLDLEVYWINDKKIIGKSFLPSILKTKKIVTVSSPALADKVIEIVIDNNDGRY